MIGVAVPLVVALAVGQPAAGFPAAFGAISAGFASQQGVYRSRAAAMLWTTLAMALSTFVGALTGHSLLLSVILTACWGYAYGIVASLGPAATTIGINSVIALVIWGHLPADLPQATLEALLVLAGGIVQTFLLVIVWPLRRFSVERHALATAARSLAQYARDIAAGKQERPSSQPFESIAQTLADPQPFARRGDIAVFQSLHDELQRVRGSLAALATDRGSAADTRAIDELALGSGVLLTELADALDAAREPFDTRGEWLRVEAAEQRLDAAAAEVHVRSEAHALAGQLRSAWRLATFPADVPVPTSLARTGFSISFPRLDDTVETLRANLSQKSPYGRLAPRVAGTLAVATILGGVLPTQHGYWIAMTAVILLRPDFTQTFLRSTGRVGGTLVGAAFATAIAAHVRPGADTYVAMCVLFAGIGYYIFKANYALFTVAITAYVTFALALVGQPEAMALRDRVLGTVVAGILTGIAIWVWPTWEAERTRLALADLIEAQRKYLSGILAAYVDPSRYDAAAIADAQRTAWSLRANAEASVDRMLGEPSHTHAIPAQTALGVLAASRRIGLASLSLDAHFPHAQRLARPALGPFSAELDNALAYVAACLREECPADRQLHLRDAYRNAQSELKAAGDLSADMILAIADAQVDAVNTLMELMR